MKRIALLCAAFAGCAFSGVPNRPLPPLRQTVRAVPQSFPEKLVTRRNVSGVTLRIYNTGAIHTSGGAVSAMKSWSSKVTLDAPCFLIQHPKEGLILFDTGLTTSTARALGAGMLTGLVVDFEAKPGQDIASQLWAEGVAVDKVKWIILSHLHLDHAGGLGAFGGATIVVSRREWEDQKAQPKGAKQFDPAALESGPKLKLVDLEGEPPYGAFDHGLDLFSDGTIELVALPGHTPGSMGAWVNLDGGPVLLAGDAAWVVDNYMDLALPEEKAMKDPVAYRHSLEVIRAMRDAVPRLVVFPGRDLTPRKLSNRDDLPLAVH